MFNFINALRMVQTQHLYERVARLPMWLALNGQPLSSIAIATYQNAMATVPRPPCSDP